MSSWWRSLWVLLAIVFLHSTFVVALRWYAGSALLTPVVLSVPDVLLSHDGPLAVTAAVFHARSGEPMAGVLLRFVVLGDATGGVEQLASTDATGRASAVLIPAPDVDRDSPPGAAAEMELGVSIIPGSRWVLTGHGHEPGVGPRHAVATVLALRPGTSILIVGFGTPLAGRFALNSEARAAIVEASRLQARTVYVLEAGERWRDQLRRELDAVGLPHGILILLVEGSRQEAALTDFKERLKAMEASVGAILCDGGEEPIYKRVFPEANVVRLDG